MSGKVTDYSLKKNKRNLSWLAGGWKKPGRSLRMLNISGVGIYEIDQGCGILEFQLFEYVMPMDFHRLQ